MADELDEELGTPDPEATGQEAIDTLEQPPGAVSPLPEAIPGQVDQQLPGVQTPTVAAPVVTAPSAVPAGTHATKGTRTVTALAPNADIVQGQAAEQRVFQDEKKLAGDQAALQGKAAEIEQQRAEQIAEETARQNAEIQAEQQRQADLAQQRAEQFSRDIDELKRAKPPGGFSEWAGGKRALASLSITLGGLAAGRTGTANLALADVNREVEQEQKRWEIGIENQYKALGARQGLNHELDNQAKDLLARGQARKVLALDSLNKYADAQLKGLGIPAAQQAGIKAQLGFDKQAADAQQKYGQLLASKVTDTTKFVPGKAGAGGGGGGSAVTKLVQMAENGSKRSEIVAAAAAAGLPEKTWKNQVDLAFKERETGEANKEKAQAAEDGRTVTLDNGEPLTLPTPRAVPQFVKGYNSRIQAAQKVRELLQHVKEVGSSPWGVDDADRRKALIHDANIAVGSISSMGQSDHSTHLELGTLGSIQPRQTPGLRPSDSVGIKLLTDKLKQIEEGTEREIHAFRKGSGTFKGAETEPAKGTPGEVRVTKDGRVLMKQPDGQIVELKRSAQR